MSLIPSALILQHEGRARALRVEHESPVRLSLLICSPILELLRNTFKTGF